MSISTLHRGFIWATLCLFTIFANSEVSRADGGLRSQEKLRALYNDHIGFDVFRNDTMVGAHNVMLRDDPQGMLVEIDLAMEIRFLGLLVYNYQYESLSLWRDGHLERIEARVDDDGELSTVNAVRESDRMVIETDQERYVALYPIYPTDHWNIGVLQSDQVLNTLTGKVNNVVIEEQGREWIETEKGTVEATHYVYSGDIAAEVWYDDSGRWVGLRFTAPDGSEIEYRCRRCQGGPNATASNE